MTIWFGGDKKDGSWFSKSTGMKFRNKPQNPLGALQFPSILSYYDLRFILVLNIHMRSQLLLVKHHLLLSKKYPGQRGGICIFSGKPFNVKFRRERPEFNM
jgi:hypothetical protein